MAERAVDHLMIGGGLAAANCARWIREEGGADGGSVLLVGRENDPPYNRPPLSKKYLGGEESRDDILFRPDEWWDEQKIELLTRTSVMKLDTEARRAKLSNGDEVAFDKALLATGANVRRLRAEHGDLDGIHYLRTIPTSDAIAADAAADGARRVHRRVVHQLRGGRDADGAREQVLDGDAGGRDVRARLRQGGRRLLPARARGARRRDPSGGLARAASRATDGRVTHVRHRGRPEARGGLRRDRRRA